MVVIVDQLLNILHIRSVWHCLDRIYTGPIGITNPSGRYQDENHKKNHEKFDLVWVVHLIFDLCQKAVNHINGHRAWKITEIAHIYACTNIRHTFVHVRIEKILEVVRVVSDYYFGDYFDSNILIVEC